MRDSDVKDYIMYYKSLPPGCNLDQYVRCVNTLISEGCIHKGSPVDKRIKHFLAFGRDREPLKDFNLD